MAEEDHAEPLGEVETQGGYALARDDDCNAAERSLHDDLGGQPSGRVQDHVGARNPVQRHPAADRIQGVAATDILDADPTLTVAEQGATVYGSCRTVHR